MFSMNTGTLGRSKAVTPARASLAVLVVPTTDSWFFRLFLSPLESLPNPQFGPSIPYVGFVWPTVWRF